MTTNSFRRLLPQVLATIIKDLILFISGIFNGTLTLLIPSLLGIATTLNQDETIRVTGAEASWIASIASIGALFGGLLSGFLSDAFGRRMTLMLLMAPILAIFIMLGTAQSFWVVCLAVSLLSFLFGLKNAASAVYVGEISEKSIRGTLLALSPISSNLGVFFTLAISSYLTWRQITLIVSIVPVAVIIAIYFIPETPSWLLSKGRSSDALKSMQCLRGWVSADAVINEFTSLNKHNIVLSACDLCTDHLTECPHSKTFLDKVKELKNKRFLKPFILIMVLGLMLATSGIAVWSPYIIQVIKAYGIPLDANFTASILSAIDLVGTCGFLLSVKAFGKRRLYLISTTIMVLCCIGLSIYGFVLFPPNWTSFENPAHPNIPDFDHIRDTVGGHGYLALALLITMSFFASFAFNNIPIVMVSEVFPLKFRSVLCGIATTFITAFSAIFTKTYYNVELWLTLPGAILFYGMITFIGLIVVYLILPETENRSLEDIEAHYADNTKKITDIHIPIAVKWQ